MPKERVPVTVVIPARYGSSRFPGKPLAPLMGKPLIQHVYERVQQAPGVERVLVATDDRRIQDAVQAFGGTAALTSGDIRTGTDRVAAIARQQAGEVFVNLQGDEIILHPELLSDLVLPFLASQAGMGTLKRVLGTPDEIHNPDLVKVVTDQHGKALYFSRSAVPWVRDREAGKGYPSLHYVHLGIYIYRRDTLLRLAELPTSPLEAAEGLEQLRALEHGIPIGVWETTHGSVRIDTPDDLKAAERVLQSPVCC
ncbi:MAG: 3-deoxy-manno-octulosonate cytidylyltransferase [Nitrospiraceae bacterium]